MQELPGELLKEVIGYYIKRLFYKPGLFHLHAGRSHQRRLAGSDAMRQQGIAVTHSSPHGVFLVLAQRECLAHARKFQVGAIKQPWAKVVVGVVINPHQPLGAVGIAE